MSSYFKRLSHNLFEPTEHVGGGWNAAEQHIAPPMGLLCHLIEVDHAARGGSLILTRISFDILGVLPIEPVEVALKVLRPGRTIELVEASLSHNGRPALIARAWLLGEGETASIAGTHAEAFPSREGMPRWSPQDDWPGGFIASIDAFRTEIAPGRAKTWARTTQNLLESEEVSLTAKALGTVDLANGTAPREDPSEVLFPNLDLTVTLLRSPVSEWLGFDTSVTFGDNGVGLTHTFLHDESGFLGVVTQSLTVRPMHHPVSK